MLDYSLFRQILGAFLQFARSLFKFFWQNFYRIIFSSSPNFPENWVEFCFVLRKLDHLTCNTFSKLQLSFYHYCETRILLHAKCSSNLQNTQQNSLTFSTMLGEDEKMTPKKFHANILNSA